MNVALAEEFLREEYIEKRKSIKQISKDTLYSVGTIFNYIKKFEIEMRTNSELKQGKNNPNYGGLSPEHHEKKISKARKGKISNHFKGGRKCNVAGYIFFIYKPNHPFSNNNGYVREHRLILEKYLKRYLKIKEAVHRVNSINMIM